MHILTYPVPFLVSCGFQDHVTFPLGTLTCPLRAHWNQHQCRPVSSLQLSMMPIAANFLSVMEEGSTGAYMLEAGDRLGCMVLTGVRVA